MPARMSPQSPRSTAWILALTLGFDNHRKALLYEGGRWPNRPIPPGPIRGSHRNSLALRHPLMRHNRVVPH